MSNYVPARICMEDFSLLKSNLEQIGKLCVLSQTLVYEALVRMTNDMHVYPTDDQQPIREATSTQPHC